MYINGLSERLNLPVAIKFCLGGVSDDIFVVYCI